MNGLASRIASRPLRLQSRLCRTSLYFSTSSRVQRHGALPTLPESFSSPELTELASNIRTQFMLPNHLTQEQKRMIYRPSLHHLLTTGDGYHVNLEGESIALQPAQTRQQPGMSMLLPAIKLVKTKEDAEGLVPSLLAEIKLSGRSAGNDFSQRLVRKLCSIGATDLAIRMADDVSNSGLQLGSRDVLREVIWGIEAVPLALPASELLAGVTAAIRRAQRMLSHLEDPRHEMVVAHPNTQTKSVEKFDLKQAPEVIGVMAELSAMQAVLLETGSAERKQALKTLEHYLRMLRASWPDFKNIKANLSDRKVVTTLLRDWAPTTHGLRLAREFRTIDGGLFQWSGQALAELEPMIEAAKERVIQLSIGDRSRGLRKLEAYEAFAEKRKALGQELSEE